MDKYLLLRFAHLIGLMLMSAGLIGVFVADMRSRQIRDVKLFAQAVTFIGVFYDGLVVPGALLLCITCCLPSQPFTSHRMPDAISFTPRARRVLCSVRPLVIIAHAILAILLASAMAATFVGRRVSNAVSQGCCWLNSVGNDPKRTSAHVICCDAVQ